MNSGAPRSSASLTAVLGALGALGPLSIDMYLPALPRIATDLRISAGATQLSLMGFFAGLMVGQLVFGPISDRIGRKPVIYAGLLQFIAASACCALAGTAAALTGWRFAQGLGGSIGTAISLAIVRDLHTGRAAARVIAMMMIVQGLAPVLAPMLGTAVLSIASWRWIFLTLALFGAACMLAVAFTLPETRQPALRQKSHPLAIMRNYLQLLASRHYIAYAATLSFAMAGFFAYLSGSAFVFMSLYGLSPGAYSALVGGNAVGLVASGQIAPRLMHRVAPQTLMKAALCLYAAASILLFVLEFSGRAGFAWMTVLLFVIITAMAFVLPLSSVMAMEHYGHIAGAASALLGALRFGAGALASFLLSLAADGTALPMTAAIALCGTGAWFVAVLTFPKDGLIQSKAPPHASGHAPPRCPAPREMRTDRHG